MADTVEKTEHLPYVPPSQVAPEELMKAFQEEGIIETPPAEAGKTATPAVATPAPAPQKDDEVPALVRIAKARDALRKEQESMKPHAEVLKRFSPQQLQRLSDAAASGDPVAALAALNFTHGQYTAKLLGESPEKTEIPEKTAPPEYESLKQEIQALKAERETERVQGQRKEALGKMESILKDNPKFSTINSMKDYEGIEKVLIQYWSENGQTLPADTFEESVALAAEVHEANLRKEAERWRGVLTGFKEAAPVAAKAPEAPRTGTESPRTLTNAMSTAPAAARTAPKSREELLEAIARGDDLSSLDP